MTNARTLLLLLGVVASQQSDSPRKVLYPQTEVSGSVGGVAADAQVCSELGLQLLKLGGSAVDAAIGSTLCQGIVYPFASGIGGGGFMVIKPAYNKEAISINFRETAPASSTQDMFVKQPNLSTEGGLSVSIPGEIKGLFEAHKLYGKLAWKQLLQPNIDLCLQGYNVTRQLAMRLVRNQEIVQRNSNLNKFYTNPDGSFVLEGQVLKDVSLAKTLTSIRDFGSDGFYKGWVAQSMVNSINSNGGNVKMDDFENYKVQVGKALQAKVFGLNVLFNPPPSSGSVTVFILKVMENYLKHNYVKEFDLEFLSQLVEAYKYGFAGRFLLGDPDFVDVDKQLQFLLSNQTPIDVLALKKNTTQPPQHYFDTIGVEINNGKQDHGTSHVSVIDRHGSIVSITSTTNTDFGSKLLDLNTGILFNNEMDDFSTPGLPNAFGLAPSKFNFIQPYKRPQSSICPLILFDKDSSLAIGASGGSRIITSVAQTLIDHLGLKLPLTQAIGNPRVHHQLLPETLRLEKDGFNQLIQQGLKEFKLEVIENSVTESNVNVVKKSNGKVLAISDARKFGLAAAY